MYLIVGLGNPGSRYEKTRHNIGFNTIDLLADYLNVKVDKFKFKGLYGQTTYKNNKIILLKPETYMNDSGVSVSQFVNYFDIDHDKLIVIVDDIDIEFGTVKIKRSGSAGTHNGLKSIIRLLGWDDFPRVKIAINNKPSYMDLANFVLSRFSPSEEKIVQEQMEIARDGVLTILTDGIDKAMNVTNSKMVE